MHTIVIRVDVWIHLVQPLMQSNFLRASGIQNSSKV